MGGSISKLLSPSQETPFCPRRSGHIALCVGENLFVWGGFQTSTDQNSDVDLSPNDLWIYNADIDFWRCVKCSGTCPPSTNGASGVKVGNCGYIIGGWIRDAGYAEQVYRLHLTTWAGEGGTRPAYTWERVQTSSPGLSPRWNFAAWSHGDRIYCFGGYGPCIQTPRLGKNMMFVESSAARKEGWNNQLMVLDTTSLVWTNPECQGQPPSPRSGHTAALLGDKVYIFGGACHGVMNDLHSLELRSQQWSGQLSPLGEAPQGRCWHSLTALSPNRLLLFGGQAEDNSPLDDLWMLTTSPGLQWTLVKASTGHPRHYHTACGTQSGNVLVFGGCLDNIISGDKPRFSEQILEFQMRPKPLEGHTSRCKTVLDLRVDLQTLGLGGSYDVTDASHGLPHVISFHDVELPQEWPDLEKRDPNEEIHVEFVAEGNHSIRHYFDQASSGKHHSVYRMHEVKRGKFLLINNENFCCGLSDRKGTEVDKEKLTQLFEKLGFEVELRSDLTASEMRQELRTMLADNHSQYDCFACAILSHGTLGGIFGTDGEVLKMDDVMDIVTGSKNQTLAGKPKLFFIQACQGEQKDGGIEQPETPTTTSPIAADGASVEKVPRIPEEKDDSLLAADNQSRMGTGRDGDEVSDSRCMPAGADILIAEATTPGFISIRNTLHGTWFIQTVVYIFSRYAHVLDIMDLLNLVQQLVSKAKTRNGGFMMQPRVGTALNKKLYFFPGLHRPRS